MPEVYLYDAIRTPLGKGNAEGSLHEVKPLYLLAGLLKALAGRHGIDTSQVDDCIIGCQKPLFEQGGNLAKAALLRAEWSDHTSGMSMHRGVCSGLDAVQLAAAKIASGWENLAVAGGVESSSRIRSGSSRGALSYDMELMTLRSILPSGISADLMATHYGISREELDAYALRSINLAEQAKGEDRGILPVFDRNGLMLLERDQQLIEENTQDTMVSSDPLFAEHGRHGYDDLALKQYPMLEKIAHVHTAATVADRADGASLVLLGDKSAGKKSGLTPLARIVYASNSGSDPTIMLSGAVAAADKALQGAGMHAEDIDCWYCLENYAVVPLHLQQHYELTDEKLNAGGGSLARGLAPGAAGCSLFGELFYQMRRQKASTGLACVSGVGGVGCAVIIERME